MLLKKQREREALQAELQKKLKEDQRRMNEARDRLRIKKLQEILGTDITDLKILEQMLADKLERERREYLDEQDAA